mmetsp:Transcript_6458/g.6668  ORF Transcript_6458/g.6668 Transcript_6458/m.6668 type:complete len:108 (-) Transcript_6458:86-409(-)
MNSFSLQIISFTEEVKVLIRDIPPGESMESLLFKHNIWAKFCVLKAYALTRRFCLAGFILMILLLWRLVHSNRICNGVQAAGENIGPMTTNYVRGKNGQCLLFSYDW